MVLRNYFLSSRTIVCLGCLNRQNYLPSFQDQTLSLSVLLRNSLCICIPYTVQLFWSLAWEHLESLTAGDLYLHEIIMVSISPSPMHAIRIKGNSALWLGFWPSVGYQEEGVIMCVDSDKNLYLSLGKVHLISLFPSQDLYFNYKCKAKWLALNFAISNI